MNRNSYLTIGSTCVCWATLVTLQATSTNAQERPSAFYVLIDCSASMSEKPASTAATDWSDTKLDEVKRQLGSFCASLPNETDVRIWTFHEQLEAGPALTIAGEQDREQLRSFFDQLEAPGRRTHLWSSLAMVLEDARKAAEDAPGRAVKLLVYSDGEDNQPRGPQPEQILEQFRELIRDRVQITYVSLGFTLRSDLNNALAKHAVRVRPSLSPADVIPLVPSFSWVPTRPVAGETVQFVDHSGGVIQAYRWDFGDDSDRRSAEKAPRHEYVQAGSYTVRLGLRSPTGETSMESRTVVVAVPEPVRAAFKAPPETVAVGAPVYFVNESQGSIASMEWCFGDGGTSSEQHPVHRYDEPGFYTVKLQVTGTRGELDLLEVQQAVQVLGPEPPRADFHSPRQASVGAITQFVARTRGVTDKLAWKIDGELVSVDDSFQHVFDRVGNYRIALTASGPGGTHTAEQMIEVVAIPPRAALIVGIEQPRTGDEIVLTDASQGDVDYVVWQLGASDPTRIDYQGDGGVKSIRHRYDKPGQHRIALTAYGPGGESTCEHMIKVVPKWLPPVARFQVDQTEGRGALLVRFVNQSEGSVEQCIWSFGDGSPDLVQQKIADASHEFGPGQHQVTLTVVGPEEVGQARFQQTISVKQPHPAWKKHLYWAVPAVATLLALTGAGVGQWRKALAIAEIKRLSGEVSCKSAAESGASWTTHPVPNAQDQFAFDVPEADQGESVGTVRAVLRVDVENPAQGPVYFMELYRSEKLVGSCLIEPDCDIHLGGYTFRYQP